MRKKRIRPRMNEKEYKEYQEFKRMQKAKGIKDTDPFNPIHFPQAGRHFVFGCAHVPFQNKAMFKSMNALLADVDFVGMHIIGDFMDLNTFSSHDRGRFPAIKGLTYTQEINESNKVLDLLMSHQEFEAKSYIWGNHEDRYHRYMKDMENAKRPLPSPTEALKLKERGFAVHENWQADYVMLGDHLQLHHGVYYNVHCAKNHLDKLRKSNIFVHTHRIQHYIEGAEGSYNIGFCGDKDSPAFGYATRAMRNQWQNGMAIVTIDKDGYYFVEQLTHINNHFTYGGKIY